MILLLLACGLFETSDPGVPCAVFRAAAQDLVSPEHDEGLEQAILALARTLDRQQLSSEARSELRAEHGQLVAFARQRSQVRSARVHRLATEVLARLPDTQPPAPVAPSAPVPGGSSLEEEATALLQQLAHDRGRDRRLLSEVEERCTP